ncbi:very long-chain specific acyl-CoA dehydrogenase, mitochondrial-like isoform X2 [Varroa jacobsoni]|uniref:Very long-chain specific acyl-CoA dehydrogenase, mitochondrial n=1 Tax=Varroa destructor TaxID=109461 RepID=A0A7M7MHQ3_VARDE|nr:very long-chain specific acyl-CoA dehydrogenase, mitochondrial-like isoform X3 [Varroa destructor]XP_022706129.1 very long-chain specific acyl-CoA dehydrogenase, mitochondrial-like isoform X2 [Varroa jacobsoni]
MLRLRASTNCVIRHGLLLSAPVGRHGLSLSAQFFGATETLSVPSIRKLSTTLGSAEEPKDRRAPAESNSFVMNLFKGDADFTQVFPYPDVLTDEQLETTGMIASTCESFLLEKNDPAKNDREGKIPDEITSHMKEMGAFGIQVPEEYGGIGANNQQYGKLCEVLGYTDLALAVTLGAHQSIGFKALLLYGNDQQKAKYLPNLASGKTVAAYCLTEPGSGSDAMSITTKAVLAPDEKHYIMNGEKIYISNGHTADIFTIFAKTPVEKDGKVKDRITCFLVERAFGVTSGPPEKKMGIKASNTTTLHFDNVKIPVENVIGVPGEGFKIAVSVLNNGRFGLGSVMGGTMRYCIEKATNYAMQRQQFGRKIASFGNVQEKLARMHMLHYMTESVAFALSGNMDRGFTDYHLEAAVSKILGSEAAWWVCDEAIQIHGGMGFMSETGLERVLRDLRIFRIFEGANDILRLFIALQGLQFAGGHLKELQRAMANPAANLGLIFAEGSKRVKRAVGMSSAPSLDSHVPVRLQTSAALASRSIEQFGASCESMLIKYGKNIINEQFLLIRLANSAIDIHAMMCCLSRCTKTMQKGLPSAVHEATLVDIICSELSERVARNLASIRSAEKLTNFKKMQNIATGMYDVGGLTTKNPLGV